MSSAVLRDSPPSKDLIEEIVGEIQDEHEENEPIAFQEVGRGVTRIWGAVSLREVNERLDLELPEDQFDTIGGYVFGSLNRIPQTGEEVQLPRGTLRVVKMRGRRVEYLRHLPATPAPGGEATTTGG